LGVELQMLKMSRLSNFHARVHVHGCTRAKFSCEKKFLVAGVAKVEVNVLLHVHLPTRLGVGDFAPDLPGNGVVVLLLDKLLDGLLLLRGDILLVTLEEDQQRLMPQHWHLAPVILEPDEVKHQGVDYPEGKGVFLVQQHPDEQAVDTRVLHLRNLEKGRAGVEHRNTDFGEHTPNDRGLTEGAISCLADGEQDSLEKGRRLVERLLQRHVEVVVQLFRLLEVVPDSWEQNEVEETLGHLGIEVGGKDPGGLEHRLVGPRVRARDEEDLLPVVQGGNDLERLGNGPSPVPRKQPSNTTKKAA